MNKPVAIRYDFDGYGYHYMDSGSGSDWQTRVEGELLYTHPVELTDEEIMDYVDAFSIDMGNVYEFQPDNVLQMIRAILDKAQEK